MSTNLAFDSSSIKKGPLLFVMILGGVHRRVESDHYERRAARVNGRL